MPGFPVLQCFPELAQTHVHWVSDAVQPSHPLSSPSPPACQSFPASGSFPVSQLVASGGHSIGASVSASVLPMNSQNWFLLGLTSLISLLSKELSKVFSNTGLLQFKSINSFFLIYFNFRLITLQYCSGFCHTLTWISHGCTCVPHLEPPSTSLPIPSLWVIPVHQPLAPCLMHKTWTGDLFHIW